ncbi:hypothetical protein [Paenibacillus hemerocallicola]|uniref:hypothetical protein n=1 Tax=Paenibacillus hemerocallicola TaxID=1172614 RepID=UPI00159EE9A7|nr:hypothetical protein [Paenibacillus hemerocallicola]
MILFVHRKDLRVSNMPAFTYISQKGFLSLHLFVHDPAILDMELMQEHSSSHCMHAK